VRPSLHRVRALERRSAYQMEEHFAPDVAVLEVGSLDEGIAALDATPYGLVASVFSASRATYERVWRELRVGLLNWNGGTVGASSRLPFGGVKRSGNARPAGVSSSLYCTYPVASLEMEVPAAARPFPGFPV
jgi:succinylglutamic semialdehyde dehydrogenase